MQPERQLEMHARISALQVTVVALLEVLRQEKNDHYERVQQCLIETAQLPENQTLAFALHEILMLLEEAHQESSPSLT